eukprot:COSAG02_NODE_5395_length_4365_cov_3.141819_3_plen_114_part_00
MRSIRVAGGAVLFTMGSEPQPVDIPPESRLQILVTNTKVPGRSTKRMVAAVGDLVAGPLGKTVGGPLLDAMGALASQRLWHVAQSPRSLNLMSDVVPLHNTEQVLSPEKQQKC